MYRIFRTGQMLACACLLGHGAAAHAADYLINEQARVATTGTGVTGLPAANFDATDPAIAVSPVDQAALVVWSADDASTDAEYGFLVDNEFEIHGRVLASDVFEGLTDPFRISVMGSDSEKAAAERQRFVAVRPAVAWNPVAEEFLVVWEGDSDAAPLVDDEFEIFAQRVNVEGKLIGERFRISAMGDDGATDPAVRRQYDAARPAVAVDTVTGHYLVTWQGDSDTAPLVDDEIEIFGRVLNADATFAGAQFRISTAGDDAETGGARAEYDAVDPVVVYNPEGYFVVAWQADGNEPGMVNDENEIFVARVDSDGTVGGSTRVSHMGPDGDADFDALAPTLAVDPATGTMIVAWHGDTVTSKLVDNELEIHGRLLNFDLLPSGEAFRISVMGSDSETDAAKRVAFEAIDANASWSPNDGKFLVAWSGDAKTSPLVDNEFEIHARFVAPSGELPSSPFRVSVHGDDEETDISERQKFGAAKPVVAHGSGAFMLTWQGDSEGNNSNDNKTEIFATRAAETFTSLTLGYGSELIKPKAPEPIKVTYVITNTMDTTAENVTVRLSMTEEFPLTWSGCDNLTEEGVCELGDIPGQGTTEFGITLTTDHIGLGDTQGTTVTVTVNSDTPLKQPLLAVRKTFLGTTVVVEGGSGAIDWFWLLMLAGMAPFARTLRRD